MATLVYACNTAGAMARFRMPVIRAAIATGYTVHCICGAGPRSETYFRMLKEAGAEIHSVAGLDMNDMRPFAILRQCREFGRLLEEIGPDIVHSFTHRANVVAYLALRSRPGIRFIPNVTGAGRLFEACLSWKDRFAQRAMLVLYKLMGKRCEVIYFQNEADSREIGGGMNLPQGQIRLTNGSGLDPTTVGEITPRDIAALRGALAQSHGVDPEKRMFVLPARALKVKGVHEYYSAARRYLEVFNDAVFVHAGDAVEGSQHGYSRQELERMQVPGLHYIGFRDDIFCLLAASFAAVLPSSYREGIPRAMIEALYLGKLVVTTDSPGCRETVMDGWNGKLVSPHSIDWLLSAFIAVRDMNPEVIAARSKLLFQNKFHAERIIEVYMAQYAEVPARWGIDLNIASKEMSGFNE